MAVETANGLCRVDATYFGLTLGEWVAHTNAEMVVTMGWQKGVALRVGSYGFDTYALGIHYAMLELQRDPQADDHALAAAVHRGWAENYQYWRDNKPGNSRPEYFPPYKPLGDPRRDALSTTPYQDLPTDEMNKDITIVRTIRGVLATILVNAAFGANSTIAA